MVRVYTATDPADAHLVCDLLIGQGVRAVVQGTALWGVRGEIPVTPATAPSVWVNEEDASQALEILARRRPAEDASRPAWVCPQCGEAIEGQFSDCWRCAPGRRSRPR